MCFIEQVVTVLLEDAEKNGVSRFDDYSMYVRVRGNHIIEKHSQKQTKPTNSCFQSIKEYVSFLPFTVSIKRKKSTGSLSRKGVLQRSGTPTKHSRQLRWRLPRVHGTMKKRASMTFNYLLFDAKRMSYRWVLARNSCQHYCGRSVLISLKHLRYSNTSLQHRS